MNTTTNILDSISSDYEFMFLGVMLEYYLKWFLGVACCRTWCYNVAIPMCGLDQVLSTPIDRWCGREASRVHSALNAPKTRGEQANFTVFNIFLA